MASVTFDSRSMQLMLLAFLLIVGCFYAGTLFGTNPSSVVVQAPTDLSYSTSPSSSFSSSSQDEPGPSRRTKRTHASARRAADEARRVHVSDLDPEPVIHAITYTDEHVGVQEEAQEQEAQEEDDSSEEEDDSEELTGSFPGGPEDPRILRSFKTHIAADIWEKKERGILKCMNHAAKIKSWNLYNTNIIDGSTSIFNGYIERSGLAPLVDCSYRYVNKLAVSAFIERWQPETNSFHLPFGEMTITLDDVHCILGIPITGRSVSADPVHFEDAILLLTETLGVEESDARREMLQSRGTSVRLEWLKSSFQGAHDGKTEEENQFAARAYLLFLLGCTLFADKTATRVPVVYLRLLSDLDSVSSVAWGAGALAYLYRQLGLASRSGVRQMAGYMTLMEAWIYEHFKFIRPHANINYRRDRPRVQRWMARKDTGQTDEHLQALRETIDCLHAEEVLWDPYESMRTHFPRSEVTWYSGLLKSLDMIEPYYPERVLRQYGRIQTIPRDPSAAGTFRRGRVPNQYRVLYQYIDGMWETWQDHVLHQNYRSRPTIKPWDSVPAYMDYFLKITHPFVLPPFMRSGHQEHGQSSQIGILSQRISIALNIGHTVYDRGQEYVATHPASTYQAIENMIRTLEGQSSSGQVYQRRTGE